MYPPRATIVIVCMHRYVEKSEVSPSGGKMKFERVAIYGKFSLMLKLICHSYLPKSHRNQHELHSQSNR